MVERPHVAVRFHGIKAMSSARPADRSSGTWPLNLPAQPGPFIGRAGEVRDARRQLLDHQVRLLTFTGPGGTGKTRLAVQVAADLVDSFPDGVFFVHLSPIRDSALVLPALGSCLGVWEAGSQPLLERLHERLCDRRLLVILDNFEQVLTAASDVTQLLEMCPELKVIVTSRERLRLRWEHVFAVPPLDLPSRAGWADLQTLQEDSPAVKLFVQRARAANSRFTLSEGNAQAVADLCVRLDGLPLAIELAAAECDVRDPVDILAAIREPRSDRLERGGNDLPPRHRTMAAAIGWSYDLLLDEEQVLFRRLAVFVGHCATDAVEAVCNAGDGAPIDVRSGLAALVRKHLLRQDERLGEGERMVYMLDTIRSFALARLQTSGELDLIRRRHALVFRGLAEQAWEEAFKTRPGSAAVLRLEREHDNLRAALGWVIEQEDAETALRMGAALHVFWLRLGYLAEGRRWLEQILALPADACTPERARALVAAGVIAGTQGDLATGRTRMEEGLAVARQIGDVSTVVRALNALASLANEGGNAARARALLDEAIGVSRMAPEPIVQAYPRMTLGWLAYGQGDFPLAHASFDEALAIATEGQDEWLRARALLGLGNLARAQGNYVEAQGLYEAGLAANRELGDHELGLLVLGLGLVATARGDYGEARRLLIKSLMLERAVGSRLELSQTLEALAALAAAQEKAEVAVRVAGAAARLRETAGTPPSMSELTEQRRWLMPARQAIGDEASEAAWLAGRSMGLDEAAALATQAANSRAGARVSNHLDRREKRGSERPLTSREREVVALVARGLSNREIAAQLVITERTAGAHVEHILKKLSFASRTQIGVWAAEHGFVTPGTN